MAKWTKEALAELRAKRPICKEDGCNKVTDFKRGKSGLVKYKDHYDYCRKHKKGMTTKGRTKTYEERLAHHSEMVPNELMFVENSTFTNYTNMKNRIFLCRLLPVLDCCWECGKEDYTKARPWKPSKKLVLELEHDNGVKTDCRLSNLRLLCPDCHSQTDTYKSKNIIVQRERKAS